MNSIPVLSASEAAAWDSVARTQYRIPSRVLMEAAGRAIVHVILAEFPDIVTRGVLVVAYGPSASTDDMAVVSGLSTN